VETEPGVGEVEVGNLGIAVAGRAVTEGSGRKGLAVAESGKLGVDAGGREVQAASPRKRIRLTLNRRDRFM
jgi:hypothetical protein